MPRCREDGSCGLHDAFAILRRITRLRSTRDCTSFVRRELRDCEQSLLLANARFPPGTAYCLCEHLCALHIRVRALEELPAPSPTAARPCDHRAAMPARHPADM